MSGFVLVHMSCASLLTNFVNSKSVSSPFSGVEPCPAGADGSSPPPG